MTPEREHIDYWIGETVDGCAVWFANSGSTATVALDSERHGPLRILRARLWALRNGCGWLEVRR